MGAEHLLARRAINEKVADKIFEIVANVEKEARRMGVGIRGAQPAPEILPVVLPLLKKSLWVVSIKAGTAPIQVCGLCPKVCGSGLG